MAASSPSSLAERHQKLLRSPGSSPAEVAAELDALERQLLEAGAYEPLVSALKQRLAVLEEPDGPRPQSLGLRKRTMEALLLRAQHDADDVGAAMCAVEAMELCAHELNDADGVKAAALWALVRNGADMHVRTAVSQRLGGDDQVVQAIKRALKKDPDPVRKAGLAYASSIYRLALGDREGAFVDIMRAVRATPTRRALVDELVRMAMEADRAREAEAVLTEVATPDACPDPGARAHAWSKAGTLRSHAGMDAAALEAFTEALRLDGELKGAIKQARRIAQRLNVNWEPPEPAPVAVVVATPAVEPAPSPARAVAFEQAPSARESSAPVRVDAPPLLPPPHLVEPSGPALLADLPHELPDPLGLGRGKTSFSISVEALLARTAQDMATAAVGAGDRPRTQTGVSAPERTGTGALPQPPVEVAREAVPGPGASVVVPEPPAPVVHDEPTHADVALVERRSVAAETETPPADVASEPTPVQRERTVVVVTDDVPPRREEESTRPAALPVGMATQVVLAPVATDEVAQVSAPVDATTETATVEPRVAAAGEATEIRAEPTAVGPPPMPPPPEVAVETPAPAAPAERTLVGPPPMPPGDAPVEPARAPEEPTTEGEPDEPEPAELEAVRAVAPADRPAAPERTLVNAVPPLPETVEDLVRAGMPARAAEVLEERVLQANRVGDLLLLGDLRERELEDAAGALDAYGRAARRLAERGDPRDVMLARAAEGALRTGVARPAELLKLAGALQGRVEPSVHVRMVRAAAAGLLSSDPGEASRALLQLYVRLPVHQPDLFAEADHALGMAQDTPGRAELRRAARERTRDVRQRLLWARERADLLRTAAPMVYAAALEDVLQDDPADGAALERMIAGLEQAHARGEAALERLVAALAAAARMHRGEAGLAHVKRLGRLTEQHGDLHAAAAWWRDALSRRPGDADALRALTELLGAAGADKARGAELLEILEVRLSIARNRKERAQEQEILARMAEALSAPADEERRLAVLKDLLAVAPDAEEARAAVEQLLSARGAFAELAELQVDLAARRTRLAGKLACLMGAAELFRQPLSNPARALECLRGVLALDGQNLSALLQAAEVAGGMGRAEETAEFLGRAAALQRGPVKAATLALLGRHHAQQHDEDAARRAYEEALAAEPGHRAALEGLLALAERTGDGARARASAAALARLDADPARRAAALLALADAAEQDGAAEQARVFLSDAVEADPSRVDARERLVRHCISQGASAEAAAALERWVADAGEDAVPQDLLVVHARALADAGRVAAAREKLRAVLRREPAHLEALRALPELPGGGAGSPADNLALWDLRILHHGDKLDPAELASVHARAGLTRRAAGDATGAMRNLRRALALMPEERPDPEVLEALAELVEEQGTTEEATALYTRLARRLVGAAAAGAWVKVGKLLVAQGRHEDAVKAFQDARRLDPTRMDAARFLMDAEVARGNGGAALQSLAALLDREADPARQADLHVQMARIHRQQMVQDDKAAVHLRRALELWPTHKDALHEAEQLFTDRKDPRGLVGVYTAAVRNLPPDALEERVAAWDKVALVRRYELRDLPGALEALQEMLRLDDAHPKAREDLARLHAEMGSPDKALQEWRGILVRDPLNVDAYRGMLSIFRRQLMFDAAYCVCATLVALEEADDEMRGVVRSLRPPFPTWPRPAADAEGLLRRLLHPRGAGPARDLLCALAPHVLPLFVKPHAETGLPARAVLALDDAPASFALAARHAMRLLGLPDITLYRTDQAPPGISLVVSQAPGLMMGPELLRGGMTPERAFAFARAAALLRPEMLLAHALGPARLRGVLEALVLRAVPGAPLEGDRAEMDRLARDMERRVPAGEWPRLLLLARDWWKDRAAHPVAELPAALQFTADRVGFVFSQDLAAGVGVLKQQAAGAAAGMGAPVRAAIRELVLFSVSAELMSLRTELGPSVNAVAAARVFSDG